MTDSTRLPHAATLRGYDRWSGHYDATDNPMVAATGWLLARDPVDVRGAAVIELGCGTGRHVAGLLAAGASHYLGVDGSPGMLEIAARRHADPRCRWLRADLAEPPPLGEAAFDVALIVLVLEHLAALDSPLAALASALRPGGRLRIVDLHPGRVAAGTVAHFSDGDGQLEFTSIAHPVPAIVAALTGAGFEIDRAIEYAADRELLAAVPKLAKHRDLPVVLDVSARRISPA